MSDGRTLLLGIPLFAGVPADHVEALADRAGWRFLDAGEWLFHQGDPADELFIVAHGSIELLTETPETVLHGIYARGEALGELSLLTGQPRSASARARRDTQLMCIGREDFERLLETQSGFATALVRVLGERLDRSRPRELPQPPLKALSLIPLHDGVPIDEFADQLVKQLRQFGPVVRLDRLDRDFSFMEASNQWVLLIARSHDPDDSWTRYCIRQADRVIGVATRGIRGAPKREGKTRGCDLAFGVPRGVTPDLEGWMDSLEPRAVHILPHGSPESVARMARRLAGRAMGVVLSGGGARGIAHIGVVEELERSGFVIDRIGGVSIGAAVGVLFAEGRSADEVARAIEAAYVEDTPLRGRTVPIVALSRGEKGLAKQFEIHGNRTIEGLDIPFFCVTSDLAGQCMVVHRRGPVAIAVSASQALPAFVPPLKDGDRLLVDGAIFNNLPVAPMVATGEGPVIAVDVSGRLPVPRAPRSRLPWLRRWLVGPAADWAPNINETVLRSILLGSVAADAAARELADVVIQPRLRGVATMRFRDVEAIRSLGREAVRQALASGAFDALMAEPEATVRSRERTPTA